MNREQMSLNWEQEHQNYKKNWMQLLKELNNYKEAFQLQWEGMQVALKTMWVPITGIQVTKRILHLTLVIEVVE